ncbi:hypothetical protein ACJIZ3_008673 [Penstemon smallii]|uniref:NB-ARC domain-containing protein n=1 Tax=Penstemon smallii TaxID=265156 RepID=A0ABD3TAU6_9LAMI
MGGIGKTTLARQAYDYHSKTQHFDIIAWVTVSQNYSAQEFFSSLIVSSKSFEKEIREHSIEEMRLRVFQTLKGRRYLVVIDDMWSTNVWDDVKTYFPDDNKKSRIIVTTTLFDVADYVDPSGRHHHKMRLMEEEQSWDLLRKKVFTDGSCPPELVSIGKVIAKSCRGLPLAIVVTAGLLSAVDLHPGSWQDIAKKVNLPGTTIDEHIKEILSLSYTNLPHYLRPCFLYMGAFPEDYKIHVSKLIKLCLAEGFLEPRDNKSMEEWAEACFEKLVKRSLVLVNKRKSNGKIKSYSLHDFVRKMCIGKAELEKFPRTNISSLAIRSIIYFEDGGRLLGTLDSYKMLRALDALKAKFKTFPEEVIRLFHLRYLAFSYKSISSFPISKSISKVHNLQTLMVHSDKRSMIQPYRVHLPAEIWNMPNLRHLVSFVFGPLPNPPDVTSPLVNLQTLSVVTNLKCTEEILKMIPNLKKLGIFYDGERKNWPEYQLNNLFSLSQLEKLSITVKNRGDSLLEDLIFPTSLRKLTLRGCIISWENFGKVSWPNLQVLKLRSHACEGDIWETNEENFPELKVLLIETTNLQIWETESSHFPVLETLLLYGCEKLREIPDVIGEIDTLQLIEVDGTNKSLLESANRIREEQESYGNFGLQVRSYRS